MASMEYGSAYVMSWIIAGGLGLNSTSYTIFRHAGLLTILF